MRQIAKWATGRQMLLLVSFCLISCTAGGHGVDSEPNRVAAAGTLELPLVAQADGDTYILSEAVFDITGATTTTVGGITTDPLLVLRVAVVPGAYEVRLREGWVLKRETALGSFAVAARLVSNATQVVSVPDGASTKVRYRFETNGRIVEVGGGEIQIGIDVAVVPDDAGAPCTSTSQCDDKDSCTIDSCADGACQHTPLEYDDLAAWWRGDGTANDSVSGSAGTPKDTIAYASGLVGGAFSFDSPLSGVIVPASAQTALTSLTFDAWIYPRDVSIERPIIEYAQETGPAGVHFWINTLPEGGGTDTRTLFANLRDTEGLSHHVGSGPGVITPNAWQHVAVTYDQTTGNAALYANGELVLQQFVGVFVPQTTYPVNIGRRPEASSDGSAGARFLGSLDELDIWSRALKPDEVRTIYLAGSRGKCRVGLSTRLPSDTTWNVYTSPALP